MSRSSRADLAAGPPAAPDPARFVAAARRIAGERYVIDAPEDLLVYSFDGTVDRGMPELVVVPGSRDEVIELVRLAAGCGMRIVPRGAGTGLSGGAIPAAGGVSMVTARLNRILGIDPENREALVEPGVVNADLSAATARFGLYFAPDPSSQRACTIGGNIAENSGGPHCLAYGATTNHVLAVEVVLWDGSVVWLDSSLAVGAGYDLCGAFVGSEGTFGIVTQARVRLLPLPEAVRTFLGVFDSIDRATRTVSAIIAAGIVPAALEMMDRMTIEAVQATGDAGYPAGATAVLLMDVEGQREAVDAEAEAIREICHTQGATELIEAKEPEERSRLWAGRKAALGAVGQYAPNYYILDGVVPRTRVPEVLARVYEVAERHGFAVANVFHAGDGNLHPLLLFDERVPGSLERVLIAGEEIMRLCVAAGGSVSGEHGIGLEKQEFLAWIFSEDDLQAMRWLKAVFDPHGLFNPGKVFPGSRDSERLAWRPPPRATNAELFI